MTRTITAVGHSNHESNQFVELLKEAGIQQVIDVRSQPYSRHTPHFNLEALRSLLAENGIEYSHEGALGGRPEAAEMYDSAGHVLYGKLAASAEFEEGVDRLEATAHISRAAIMCGEEDPTECHRRLLVGRVMIGRGWRIEHLRGDGRLVSEDQLSDVSGGVEPGLFEGGEYSTWRSIRSVSPGGPPRSSSRS